MKRNLTILALTILVTGAFAQNRMMHLPDSTNNIGPSTNTRGVAIGPGFNAPEARLHIRDEGLSGTSLIIEMENQSFGLIDSTTVWENPDYFMKALFKDNALVGAATGKFSIDYNGKVQSGFINPAVTDQLAVRNNFGIYASVNRNLRFDLTGGGSRMFWESPGHNFEFVNADSNTVALRLSENGQVGVNTSTFTDQHKLHVEGGTLSDYNVVQPAANWVTGGNYMGMYFSDRPQIRWDSNDTSYFEFKAADTGEVPLRLTSSGKVGINTDNFGESNHSLYIAGSSIAEEMFVKLSDDWGDFVFEKEYDLMPLDQLEDYLEENKHLPDFPSAEEVEKDGLALGETERLLTIKVEELTLYILELKKEIDTLREEIKD